MGADYQSHTKFKLRLAGNIALRVSKLFAVIVLSTAILTPAQASSPLILPTKPEVWQSAKTTNLPVTLQIGFRTDLFNRYQDTFSSLVWELPSRFPNFDLNQIGWGLHSTLLAIDAFSMDDAVSLISLFKSLDEPTLQKHGLLGQFTVFDPSQVEVVVSGTHVRTLSLRPTAEFRAWHLRFWDLLKERAPDLYVRHFGDRMPSDDDVSIALLECGRVTPCDDAATENARQTLTELLRKVGKSFLPVTFDPRTSPIQMVSGNLKTGSPPISLSTFIVDTQNKMVPSTVGSWVTWIAQKWKDSEHTSQIRTLIEFENEKLHAGESAPFVVQTNAGNNWYRSPRFFGALDRDAFQKLLTPNLAAAFARELPNLSVYNYPAQVDETGELFVLHKAYAKLAPERAVPLISPLRELEVKSSARVSKGLALYGSTTKSEILNPSDSDLLLNSLVHVPDSITNIDQAEAYARKAFVEETLGQLIALAKTGKIAFSELRIGSDFTMGLDEKNPDIMGRYEKNPYLTQQDVFNGTYTDAKGRLWTIEQLVALGDFMKAKIDLFPNGTSKRVPISLQFFLGFEWQGKPHFLRRNGLKGAHSTLMETGVYFGAESFAIAATLDRIISYYVGQRGHNAARAIGELLPTAFPKSEGGGPPVALEPYWKSKFLKRFYSFLIVLRKRNGGGMDEIFFEESKKILEREGRWDSSQSLLKVTRHLLKAINRPEVALLSRLKDIANDLAEFSERGDQGQELTPNQWLARSKELREQLPELKALIVSGKLPDLGPEFWDVYHRFSTVTEHASPRSLIANEGAGSVERRKVLFAIYSNFKHQLEELDVRFNTDTKFRWALPQSTRDLVATMTSLSPHFYSRYIKARAHPSLRSLRLLYRLMGIQPTEAKYKLMNDLDMKLDSLSRAEIARVQSQIFGPSCEDLLL